MASGDPGVGDTFGPSLLDALPNPIFVKDERHRWVLLNQAFCRFMGHERAELLGRSDFDFFPREEAEVFWRKDDVVFTTGAEDENEERFTDRAGRVHVILTRKSLHVDAAGRRLLVGVITDITDRKEMEDELLRSRAELERRVAERTAALRRANEQLAEADRRKSEFLAVLSHELRNPLAPMTLALELLRGEPTAARAAEAHAVLSRQVEHLTRMVNDLLDATRVARGKVQLEHRCVDLADVVLRAVDDHRPLLDRRGIVLRTRLDRPAPVRGDRIRIAQVVSNLLQNAAKFTPSGGEVAVVLERGAGRALLRVRDTGAGIAPELLPVVFEPFTQGDTSLHRPLGGLGLGLALVKGLVELHGGTVRARSDGPGRGAVLEVELPLAMEDVPAAEQPRSAPTARRRVLVVEDNVDAAEMLQVALEDAGHEVRVANDGLEGLAAARADPPDVVLCDLGLPGIDGYEVARAIRADPGLARVRLVALSGYALPEDVRRAREAGFDRHLGKPVSLELICEALAR